MPDLIFYNAKVVTMDSRAPFAELVAIQKGKIAAVTGNDQLKTLKTPKTQVIDCHGRTLLPGFIDAHCHLRAFAESLITLDLSTGSGIRSIADIRSRIRRQARTLPPGTWIRGHGYHEFDLVDKRHPTREDLDRASPHHPVKLSHKTGHAHVLNSLALNLVGLSRYSADPEGGIMDRALDTGEPTGLLYEMGGLLAERVPRIREDEMEKGIKRASRLLLSLGVTSLYDASAKNGQRQWDRFVQWKKKEPASPKIGMFFDAAAMERISEGRFFYGRDPHHLRALGVKIILDETTGSLHPPEQDLHGLVSTAHGLELQVAIHAVEETAIAAACAAIRSALMEKPSPDHRHRLEHAFLCPPHLAAHLTALGTHVVTQPGFLHDNGDRYLKTVPNNKHADLYPIGSLTKRGVTVAAGSDCPVGPLNPFTGIYAAISRATRKGAIISPREGISLADALALYTRNAARTAFEEGIKGSIVPGKTGDLILLNGDLLQCGTEAVKEMKVNLTVLDGRIVWVREPTDH